MSHVLNIKVKPCTNINFSKQTTRKKGWCSCCSDPSCACTWAAMVGMIGICVGSVLAGWQGASVAFPMIAEHTPIIGSHLESNPQAGMAVVQGGAMGSCVCCYLLCLKPILTCMQLFGITQSAVDSCPKCHKYCLGCCAMVGCGLLVGSFAATATDFSSFLGEHSDELHNMSEKASLVASKASAAAIAAGTSAAATPATP